MDFDTALSIASRRLARRSVADKRQARPRLAPATAQPNPTPNGPATAALQRSLHVLILAKSRLHHALTISEALR